MTYVVNRPEDFPREALAGFCAAHGSYVQPVDGGVVRSTSSPTGEVAVVVGGGSGHYPAFAGWVGPGLAHGAVCGNIFSSPSASQAESVAINANNGGGVLMLFGNYAGDVLHFGAAATNLRSNGVDCRIVTVSDDIASNPPDRHTDRRGIAGDLIVAKIAGAAAQRGDALDRVEEVARRANDATRSLGVAFSGCTLPGAAEPLFRVPDGELALGLGIHGEPGLAHHPLGTADDLAELLWNGIAAEEPARAPGGYEGRVAVIINGLGATKYEELFVLFGAVRRLMLDSGHTVVMPVVDEAVTSLDMAGASLTVLFLDAELESLWTAPCDSPAFRTPAAPEAGSQRRAVTQRDEEPATPGTPESAAQASRLAEVFRTMESVTRSLETELGRLDSIAGDGDHGRGMVLGAAAAARAASRAVDAGAGARTTVTRAGRAWAEGAGGTSGALWGAALVEFGASLSDDAAADRSHLIQGAIAGGEAIGRLGSAKVGEKTMVDAVVPFITRLRSSGDASLRQAWLEAAQAAQEGAEGTAALVARKGRARTHGDVSLGHPDPGAVSFAALMRAVGDSINDS